MVERKFLLQKGISPAEGFISMIVLAVVLLVLKFSHYTLVFLKIRQQSFVLAQFKRLLQITAFGQKERMPE